MKKTAVTSNTVKHECEFCKRSFAKETTLFSHVCQYKHRWIERDKKGNRIGFQAWLQFYLRNSTGTKNRTVEEFIKSPYYNAFVKFGNHCVEINAVNISRFTDWLLKEQIKIDVWCTDTVYTKYLIDYTRNEDAFDAIARSIETSIKLAEQENIQTSDCLRYCNPNRICYAITTGKISPWLLYQSDSGTKFLSELNEDQVSMVISYISPEQWAIKFRRDPDMAKQVKELLKAGGY